MKIAISIFVSYIALYLVIYLHEVRHALLYHRYGCKKKWYKVTVKPYMFFSTLHLGETPARVTVFWADSVI